MSVFQFKTFTVQHHLASQPVGIDAVTLGAWAQPLHPPRTIADLGTGCGIVALMLAQRFPNTHLHAIDVHLPSVEEAQLNAHVAGWSHRISVEHTSLHQWTTEPLDWMVCNPPFFTAGTPPQTESRRSARFLDEPPTTWAASIHARSHAHSSVSMIGPPALMGQFQMALIELGWHLCRETTVSNQPQGDAIRILATWSRDRVAPVRTAESYREGANWSSWYRNLTADFYTNLK